LTGAVVWITGLPAAGKSVLAEELRRRLAEAGRPVALLDGDEVRDALVPRHGYDEAGRDAFYQTLGRLAALLARQGLTALVAATAHKRVFRDRVRAAVDRFVEVHVATPAEECARRDPKGLYARKTPDLPGGALAYQPPERPEVVAQGGHDLRAVEEIMRILQ
jgi:adenylylsulfate kinase